MTKEKLDYSVILFDLDGTLTDSAEGIIKSVQYSAEKMGKDVPEYERLMPFVGPPLRETFNSYFGFEGDDLENSVSYYREYFARQGITENKVYEGIPKFLRELKGRGKVLGIASSKPEKFVKQIVKTFDIEKYFDYVGGSTFDERLDTKGKVINYVIEELGINNKSDVLMVGDRKYDVEGAKEAGVKCIGVAYGYGGCEELKAAGADYIAYSIEDLESMI